MLFGRDDEMLSSSFSQKDCRVSPTLLTSEDLPSRAEPAFKYSDQCELNQPLQVHTASDSTGRFRRF